MRDKLEIVAAMPVKMGVYMENEGLHVTAAWDEEMSGTVQKERGIVLYDRKNPEGLKIPFPEECRTGRSASMILKGYHDRSVSYLFYQGDRLYQDPWACCVEKDTQYGKKDKRLLRCKLLGEDYDWQGDTKPHTPYEECIFYALHVRGFTRHRTSGVKKKGTFAGITEKTDYLKKLGITSLLLMPAYEFNELLPSAKAKADEEPRINYWGYQKGLYQVPKSAYAYGKDAVTEFKDMVKQLHAAGLEVVMQFYFPPEIRHVAILQILKYWVLEYHVDGFHVMGVDMPLSMLVEEPVLADTKLLTENRFIPDGARKSLYRMVGFFDDGFLYEMRKFLKGDDNMMGRFLYHIRDCSVENGIINCIARWDGMRLMDLVSYDRKHNEKNGEENLDGTDYNCSWNCGVEGKSRKKAILSLRLRQLQNAMTFLLFSQGTPLLYSGDEFGFSQEGNNNPYCQDNGITWVNWKWTENGEKLLAYTEKLIELRKKHGVLRNSKRPLQKNAAGYPDISFHGHEAWKPDTGSLSRCVGIMFSEGDFILYMGVNMHWESHTLGLPQLSKGSCWVPFLEEGNGEQKSTQTGIEDKKGWQEIVVEPRTVSLYLACIKDKEEKKGAGI